MFVNFLKNHSEDYAEKGDHIGVSLIIQGKADGGQTKVVAVKTGGLEVYMGSRTYRI